MSVPPRPPHTLPPVPDLEQHRYTRPVVRDLAYYDDRAHGLMEVLSDGAPSTIAQVRSWHPAFANASDETIRSAALTLDDARLIYARQHGFASWERLAEHLRALDHGDATEPFLDVLEAGRNRDWDRATELLRAHPDLIRARGTNGNTLLNLACSMVACPAPDESASASHTTAGDAAEPTADRLAPVQALLAAGADPNQANERGWTPLHQAAYRNDPGMVALLLAANARVDLEAHGAGGTPLAVALFWGHRAAAELLARVRVVPPNLRMAAGLGARELVDRCFDAHGRLTAEACSARGFYRPHSGFPRWRPSDDPQEVLDEALVWAAKSDRTEIMPTLVERGAKVDADPYRGTPLLWAASTGRLAAAAWLLDHGADVNQRATFGGPMHGEGVTALHLAAQQNHLEMATLLVEHGADVTLGDALYHSTPARWAAHEGAPEVAAYLEGLE